jgi:membrane protease YdiL (CAAX protease family)
VPAASAAGAAASTAAAVFAPAALPASEAHAAGGLAPLAGGGALAPAVDEAMAEAARIAAAFASEARPVLTPKRTNVALLELVLLVFAFLGPALAVWLAFPPDRAALLMPFVGLASGLAVLAIGARSKALDASTLGGAAPLRYLEALAAAAGFLVAAFALQAALKRWMPEAEDELAALVETLGLPGALFCVAFCPGVFEELAFRGVVQGRFLLLFGRPNHLALTATAFAFAHGVTPALPLHFGIGLYLCFLRERAGSLWPGVLLHAVYNGALVVAASANA